MHYHSWLYLLKNNNLVLGHHNKIHIKMPVVKMKRSLSLKKLVFLGVRPDFCFLRLVCCIKEENHLGAIAALMYYRSVHTLCQKGNKTQSLCFDAKRRKCHQYLYLQIGFLPAFSSVFYCTSAKNVKAPRFLDTYTISLYWLIIQQVFKKLKQPE